jgi:hypothetical protein
MLTLIKETTLIEGIFCTIAISLKFSSNFNLRDKGVFKEPGDDSKFIKIC